MARPNHNNFAECNTCRKHRIARLEDIKTRATREVRAKTRAKQVAHIAECRAERRVTEDLDREASRSQGTKVSCADDKLGSHWVFLPMPEGGRESKAMSSLWKYRQCIQGNSYHGVGNFLSFVPPMLRTGANFGCTSFCMTLYTLIKQGKITEKATYISRLTDRGPDNDGFVTHAVHECLVHEGVFDCLDWLGMEAGHSHNKQDMTFSKIKNIFFPKSGAGRRCATPSQYIDPCLWSSFTPPTLQPHPPRTCLPGSTTCCWMD